MSRRADRSLFVRLLKLAMWVSLAAALVQLLVALFRWRMSGLPAQLVLTCVCVFLGAMFMYVQLRARHRAGPGDHPPAPAHVTNEPSRPVPSSVASDLSVVAVTSALSVVFSAIWHLDSRKRVQSIFLEALSSNMMLNL